MTSYDIGGTLVDNEYDAVLEDLSNFIHAGGLNSAETVATFSPEEVAQEWLASLEEPALYARVVGAVDEHGEDRYQRIPLERTELIEMAQAIIFAAAAETEQP